MPRPSTATPDGEREEEGSSPELPHKERDMLDIKWGSFHHKKTAQVRSVCVWRFIYTESLFLRQVFMYKMEDMMQLGVGF